MEVTMDAKQTSNPNEFILSLSLQEASEINFLVDSFRHWELIASRENTEPMKFMLRFGRDCGETAKGFPTLTYPFESGQVILSREQIITISKFLLACVNSDEKSISWLRRVLLKLASKTLSQRVNN